MATRKRFYKPTRQRTMEQRINTTEEYCPHCDTAVELEATMGVQKCPKCGKALATCSLCAECVKPCFYEEAAEALNDLQTLTTTLDEALRRERIAVQELQKMRQRAERAEKEIDKLTANNGTII